MKEKAQAIQFTDNKTLFDYGVYLHYDNYNGKGIVYGKEYIKIGYEKYDRGLKAYLIISEEAKNNDYPFNFRVGTSLQEVLEKLQFIDRQSVGF